MSWFNAMSKSKLILERASAFDKLGILKHEVDRALTELKDFRQKYPFTENLRSIEWLDPDKLFKVNPDEIGEFFRTLEGYLKPLGYQTSNSSNVFRNTRLQISDFKGLLRIVVDYRKSLAQKVDARWERVGGFGQDKQLPLKIIFSFNYESGNVFPIFNIKHLKHFVSRTVDVLSGPTKYFSFGQEYEHYTNELLKAKNDLGITKDWGVLYFTRFLYQTFPPPDIEPTSQEAVREGVVTDEQLDLQGFMKMLGELQKQGKITGEQFRENRGLWMQQPSERAALAERLKKLLI
jgi:hypothetical protein